MALSTHLPIRHATTANADLRRVLEIRLLLLVVCMAALLFAARTLDLPIPLPTLAGLIGTLVAATAVHRWWVGRQERATGHATMTLQLLFDVAILTAILYLTGGWTNPLVSLYLVPIAAATTLLPRAHTWFIAGVAAVAYSLLTRSYRPIFDLHHGGDHFALHVTGMWLTFVIAAALLAYFGTRFTETLRRRDRALAQAREANLRNEQIMGVATLAAGTAHELATPLATISVIAAELRDTADAGTRDDLAELARQVDVCREILQRLRSAAAPATIKATCGTFIDEVAERFQLLRPAAPLRQSLPATDRNRSLDVDPVLHQALLNLLDNAANVSPEGVELAGRVAEDTLTLEILDRGPGFDGTRGSSAGLGMGLVLANTTIERRGGSVVALPRPGGGSCLRVTLPLVEPDGAPA
jgi:two-component system sensor histidine kinase RegB